MANLEVIALDTVTPQLKAPQAGDGYAMPRPVAITGTLGVTGAATATSLALGGATLGANAFAVTGNSSLTGTFGVTGAATATSLALNGATIGTNAFAVTGNSALTGAAIITEPVGSTALTLTGATQTTAIPVFSATQTWNNAATTFTAAKINVINTASNAASLLMDLQVGGASRVSIYNNAQILLDNGASGNARKVVLDPATGVQLRSDKILAWTTSTASSTLDAYITRKAAANFQFGDADAAAPVAQTIGPQSVVAGTTDTAGANFTIRGSQGTGTGAGGSLLFQTAPAGTTGTAQNALVTRLTITAAGTASFSGSVVLPTAGSISFTSRGGVGASADGVFQLTNNASTDFNRLCIGLATSAFPSIKRSTTIAQIRLADDSAYAPLEASTVRTAIAYTVATLPAAGTAGRRAYVTDATAPIFLGALTGGGAVVCPVFDNGTAWVAG